MQTNERRPAAEGSDQERHMLLAVIGRAESDDLARWQILEGELGPCDNLDGGLLALLQYLFNRYCGVGVDGLENPQSRQQTGGARKTKGCPACLDAVGLDRFALLGISQGCAVSIAYAVRHPERVTRLVLYGGFAQGAAKRARTQAEREQLAAVLTLVRLGGGQENPAFRQIFTSQFVPQGTKEQIDWWNEMQRVSASPENAARFMVAVGDIDVTDLLPKVTVPTLVIHARDEARVPFDAGRRMAAGISGARLVSLSSRNHLILESEPAYAVFLDEIRSFLDS